MNPENLHQEQGSNDLIPFPGEFTKLVKLTLNAYKQNFPAFLSLSIIQSVPNLIVSLLIFFTIQNDIVDLFNAIELAGEDFSITWTLMTNFFSENLNFILIALLPLFIVQGISSVVSNGGILLGSAQFCSQEKVSATICLNYVFSRVHKLIAANLLVFLLLIIPIILVLFIVGIPILIYLVVRLWFVNSSIMIENKNVFDSINNSWELVQQRWWVTFVTGLGILFLSGILNLILTSTISLIFSINPASVNSLFLNSFVSLFIIPISTIATGIYFIGLRESKKY